MNKVIKKIKKQIESSNIIIYIKGTPKSPMCLFSKKSLNYLIYSKINFNYVNILENPDIHLELPFFSKWPTFPQIWINCKFIGGFDIIQDLYIKGNLIKILKNIYF
ncbi:MAG: glutaredoxin domain-containing protein [Enterobacterales bacterium]